MRINDLYEAAEPKLPGAPSGISIMTPQQFVAKAGDMPAEPESTEPESEEVAEGSNVVESGDELRPQGKILKALRDLAITTPTLTFQNFRQAGKESIITDAIMAAKVIKRYYQSKGNLATAQFLYNLENELDNFKRGYDSSTDKLDLSDLMRGTLGKMNFQTKAVGEGDEHLSRIRKLSGIEEATELPAPQRDFGGQEFQDYMGRIVGDPVTDPETGEVKRGPDVVSKKTGEVKPGPEKYVSGKLKSDRYKMPYIHRSSVIEYIGPDGETFDEEAVKRDLSIRPKALLKQNEKMKHSNGEFEQFFNIGFAALTGIAVDESTGNLIIVNTCPGAGSCKVDCFAMKGGKVQFKGPWLSDGRILTYLLNDPTGFFNQLSNEISQEEQLGAKGDKEYPNGWDITVRWHDAGDFFSPEYLALALKMAAEHPNVKFYAYTKMAGAALAKKPDNFIINWSEGASTAQEKQIKAQDPNLEKTKNSRIVPKELFYDLLAKDEKGNLSKGPDGQWRPASPEALAMMKDRIANEYNISSSSILSYNEYIDKIVNKQWKIWIAKWLADNNTDMETLKNELGPKAYNEKAKDLKNLFLSDKMKGKVAPVSPLKFNVIVAPGEGDISANDPAILSTLLLKH